MPQGAAATYNGLIPNRSRASSSVRALASQMANANIPRKRSTHAGPSSSYKCRMVSVSPWVAKVWPRATNPRRSSW